MTYHSKISELLQERIQPEFVFCQVLVQKASTRFDLRHIADRQDDSTILKKISISDLRGLAQATATGAFRPLKAAPNLQRGWRIQARSMDELVAALEHLYPGGLADWMAAQSDQPPVTSYRDYTERQTGMYRSTTFLNDAQAATMIRACCDRRFCLKQRLWSVDGLEPDQIADKSILPCLEPCAVLLEFARKVNRLEQDEKITAELATGEATEIQSKLEHLLQAGLKADQREADFSNPDNPRILLWKLLKIEGR